MIKSVISKNKENGRNISKKSSSSVSDHIISFENRIKIVISRIINDKNTNEDQKIEKIVSMIFNDMMDIQEAIDENQKRNIENYIKAAKKIIMISK
jgi:effector-binding domain-containing protein